MAHFASIPFPLFTHIPHSRGPRCPRGQSWLAVEISKLDDASRPSHVSSCHRWCLRKQTPLDIFNMLCSAAGISLVSLWRSFFDCTALFGALASSLPVCSDIRGAVPSAGNSLQDLNLIWESYANRMGVAQRWSRSSCGTDTHKSATTV